MLPFFFYIYFMIVKFEEQIEKINLIRKGEIKEGLKLNIPAIDERFRFKFGNFNVILGHANVGKTTVILYMMLLYTLKHKIKWLVFSAENEPYYLIKKIAEFVNGQVINKIPEDKLKKTYKFIGDHFMFVENQDLYTYKDILTIATNLKKAWDYQGFLIDPYNSLIKDYKEAKMMNSHEYDYMATSRFRLFAKKHNVSIWLNTHANTEALRKKHSMGHEYAEHPIPPMASDVEGGGKFVNRCDDFIVIHRYIQHRSDWMYSMIHVRKVKDVDTGGRPTPLDEPIRLKSLKNNVGFQINNTNLIERKKPEQKEVPF